MIIHESLVKWYNYSKNFAIKADFTCHVSELDSQNQAEIKASGL